MTDHPNGGPAFPRPISTDDHDNPCNVSFEQDGMTLRDWFAGQAIPAVMADIDWDGPGRNEGARWAYLLADAMLKARDK